jgi:hypothetical protein
VSHIYNNALKTPHILNLAAPAQIVYPKRAAAQGFVFNALPSPRHHQSWHLYWHHNALRRLWVHIRNTLQQRLDNLIRPSLSCLLDLLHLRLSLLVRILFGLLVSARVLRSSQYVYFATVDLSSESQNW